jgi:hypothetical protein
MYSKKVNAENIKKASKKIGFELIPHEVHEVARANKRLNELLGDDGRLIRPLTTEEMQWVHNERILSRLDFLYWATRYAFIRTWESTLDRFVPNIAQRMVIEIWGDIELQGRAISTQQLKARQLGISTVTELAVAHRVQFYRHTNAVVASSDPKKSAKMAEMMERCWNNEPWWMMPKETSYTAGELIEFGGMNSGVSIQHGSQFTGIARGDNPNVAHISELSSFVNPEQLIDASLLAAMHEFPGMFLVLESTALGRKNWWHHTWEYSKQYWASGMARHYPMFLPWFVGRDLYPTPGDMKARPIPQEWEPAQLTLHHAQRAKAYVASDPLLKKYLGSEWEMPVEQMWWWEVKRQEYAAKKELAEFYSEYPADDMEAFQSTNVSAFDSDTLTIYREMTKEPLGVFGFVGRGDQIPTRMQPDRRDVDQNMPAINIRARWNPTIEPFECQMVPLKFHGYSNMDPHGKLFMWEMPEDNETYGLGVDTGDGVGLDRSVIEVLRKGTLERNDAQVAEFVNPYINAFDLWTVCMAVGTLYSPPIDGYRRQAKMVIDCLKNGESTQWELRKHGWGNFHIWTRLDNKRIKLAQANKLGWFSNSWARAMMMDYAIKALRDEFVDINSPYFVDEMADLERDEYRQSLKAVFGGHDDRFVAFGQVFISLHLMEIRGNMTSTAEKRMSLKAQSGLDPVYSPGWQATDERRPWSNLQELEERALMIDSEDEYS